MSIIEISLSDAPVHIKTSDFVKGLIEISSYSDSSTPLIIPQNIYCEFLDIKSNVDLIKIVEADAYFGFSRETRVKILKNVYNFWLFTEVSIEMPNRGTILGDSINELLCTPDNGLINSCMKNGLIELYMYCIQSNNVKYKIEIKNSYSHSVFTVAIVNKHYELFRMAYLHELDHISAEDRENFFIYAIESGEMNMVQLMLQTKTQITEKVMQAVMHSIDKNVNLNSNIEKFKCRILPLLYENGGPLYMNSTYRSAIKGCKYCLEYIIDTCFEDRIEIIKQHKLLEATVRGKNIECYKFIHQCLEAEDELPERLPILEAVEYDAGAIFNYLVNLGVAIPPICVDVAIQSKCIELPPSFVKKFCKDTI